jgi:transcriptional regulator with XRE-family HTH domain
MRNDSVRKAIAAEVRAEVARQGRTLRELAEATGIDESSMSRRAWGHRSFRAEELSAVADWLGVSVAQFMPRVSTGVAT